MYYICNLNTLGVEFLNDRGFTVDLGRKELNRLASKGNGTRHLKSIFVITN